MMMMLVVPCRQGLHSVEGTRLNWRQTSCFCIILPLISHPMHARVKLTKQTNKYIALYQPCSTKEISKFSNWHSAPAHLAKLVLWVARGSRLDSKQTQCAVGSYPVCIPSCWPNYVSIHDPTRAIEFRPNKSDCLFLHNFACSTSTSGLPFV